ncbi:MAG: hypothetical protein JW854_06140 [Actinobacteria bacterium]|nr:hypothetical protein [Actinomycetota bacterium]
MEVERMNAFCRGLPTKAGVLLAVSCLLWSAIGCGGSVISRNELEEIDNAFRASVMSLEDCMEIADVLGDFTLDDTAFIDEALGQVRESRDASLELLASAEELQARDYGGSELGTDMQTYCDAVIDAQGELETVLTGVENILRAVEPALREEISMSGVMESQDLAAEVMRRLTSINEALEGSLSILEEIDTPAVLARYKSFYVDLLTAMQEVVTYNISALQAQGGDISQVVSPSLAKVAELISGYPQLIEEIFNGLKITGLDTLVERIELEINRLYMGESQ